MICERCGKEHDGSFGSGRFCSRACANSRVFSEAAKKKKSKALKGKPGNGFGFKSGFDPRRKQWTPEDRKLGGLRQREACERRYLETSFEDLSWNLKKRRVIEEQKGACNRCHSALWLELPLVLEIHHKDGNNKNDERTNLEGLCPNCHSLTDTWRSNRKQ